MTEVEAIENLRRGTDILSAVLAPHGFSRSPIKSGPSSGGMFASCEFARGDRRLQLHFRWSLGLVSYQVGVVTLSPEDYMWSVCGRWWATNYPGFSEDPLDGFRHLAKGLEEYGQDFLFNTDSEFVRNAERAPTLKRTASRLPG